MGLEFQFSKLPTGKNHFLNFLLKNGMNYQQRSGFRDNFLLLELDNHGQRSMNLCNKVKRIQRRYHYTFKCNEKYCDAFVTLQHKYVDGCLGNDFNDVTVDSEISCYRMHIEDSQ